MITKVFWKRTYLFFEYDSEDAEEIALCSKESGRKVVMHSKELGPGKQRAKLNIAIAEGREMLDEGMWSVINEHEETIRISDEVMFGIEDISRIFRYSQDIFAYTVTFELNGDDPENIGIRMNVAYMQKNAHKKKQRGKIRLIRMLVNIYYQIIVRLSPNKGNRVLFMSDNMDHIRDNMLAIDRRIRERGLDSEFKVSYHFRNIFGKKQSCFDWIRAVNAIAKNDIIFVDDYVPVFSLINLYKTKLIQTWHAGFGFKLVGYARFGIGGSPHPFVSCHRKYDYALVGNDHLREIYSEVFGIEEEALLSTGMPRLDHFLDREHMHRCRRALYEKYGMLLGRKVILFAPTYRGLNQKSAYYDYDKIDRDRLYKWCKENNFSVLFKMHHFIEEPFPVKAEHRDLFIDVAQEQINELFYISDILITDYSSCFYDYLLLGQPVLFFVYDKAYYSATRGVHRPIDSVAPGKICRDFDELMTALQNEDYGKTEAKEMLIDKCRTSDLFASDKVIDFVLLGKEVPGICKK